MTFPEAQGWARQAFTRRHPSLDDVARAIQQAVSLPESQLATANDRLRGLDDATSNMQAEIANLRAERDLWEKRANNLLDIAKAAAAVSTGPYELYASRGYSGSYLVNKKEFEELRRAVEALQKASAEEGK